MGDEFIATDDLDKDKDLTTNERVTKFNQTSVADFLKYTLR